MEPNSTLELTIGSASQTMPSLTASTRSATCQPSFALVSKNPSRPRSSSMA